MSNGNFVMKIKRLVRASVLDRRNMSQACAKKGVGLTESKKVLTSWASFSIPLSKILLVSNFRLYFGNSCNCRCYNATMLLHQLPGIGRNVDKPFLG